MSSTEALDQHGLVAAVRRLAALALTDEGDVRAALADALQSVLHIDTVEHGPDAPTLSREHVTVRRTIDRATGRVTGLVVPLPARGGTEMVALRTPGLDAAGVEAALAIVAVASAAHAARAARESARIDPLTGLLNHGAMRDAVVEEIARASRTSARLACLMVDLDRFKDVNDRHGHAVGDLVLQRVADVLHERSRPYDRLCRYGGDEFLVLMPGMDAAEAAAAAERIRAGIAAAIAELMDVDDPPAASIGVAERQDGDSPESLLEAADRALLAVKHAGRNGVRCSERGKPSG